MPKELYYLMIDEFAGVLLTAVGSLPARCAPRGDLATRRSRPAFSEPRAEKAAVFAKKAEESDRQG